MSKSALNLIKKSIQKRRKENPKFSIRKVALKLRISSGYLSKVLTGQKNLTEELAFKLCENLQMDGIQKEEVRKSYQPVLTAGTTDVSTLEQYELAPHQAEKILAKWYYTAVLDLITLDGFQESLDWIADRLLIRSSEAKEALEVLNKLELVSRNEVGRLYKKNLKIRFPTTMSKQIVREYHEAQMKRALTIIGKTASPQDFQQRLIVGLTIAADPGKIEVVKNLLHETLYKAANILSESSCTELYQLNLQLFPQTKR